MDEKCELCKYWLFEGNEVQSVKLGLCRRFPPNDYPKDNDEITAMRSWVTTQGEDWCGEFEKVKGK